MSEEEGKRKTAESENKKMFRARFDLFVLNALAENNGASYGYDVINYIQTRTKGHYKIKTFSTIYNTLKRLEEQGYVVSGKGDGETNGATRVYYTLTEEGKAYLEENKQEYKYLRTLLDNLLTDEVFDLENEEAPYSASTLKPLTRRVRSDVSTDDTSSPSSLSMDDVPEESAEESEAAVSADESSAVTVAVVSDLERVSSPTPTDSPKPVKKYSPTAYKAVFESISAPVVAGKKKTRQSASPLPAMNVGALETAESSRPVCRITTTDRTNVDRLKRSLQSEGYSLSAYNRGTKKEPARKYVYINKLLRDTAVLSALYVVVCSLLLFLLRPTFGFSLAAMISCIAVASLFALVFFLIWFRTPEKRKKDTVNLKAINAVTIVVFTVFFMVDLIIALLTKNGGGLKNAKIYSPVILASVSVFVGVVFTLLYKSERYFQQ